MPPSPKRASSQVSWALLTEGVTAARVDLHRVRLMLNRALALVEKSSAREHLYQVAGDLVMGLPARLSAAETSLDRTAYALSLMGEGFLRARLPLSDRVRVDEAEATAPYSPERRSELALKVAEAHLAVEGARRVAERYLTAKARKKKPESAEKMFFDNPQMREVREFGQSKAVSNDPATAVAGVKNMENAALTPSKARQQANKAPPTPSDTLEKPGAAEFSTLNRFIVVTEQPGVKGVPESRDDLPKAPKPRGGTL